MAADNTSGPLAISLLGAPDDDFHEEDAFTRGVQVMQLDMSNDVLEELLACTRSGKTPQVFFGRNPMLRFGAKSRALEVAPAKFKQEYYQSVEDDEEEWEFAGLVEHALSVQKFEDATAGVEEALQVFKNNMASIEHDRDSKKINTPDLSSKGPRSLSSAASKPTHLHPNHITTSDNGQDDLDRRAAIRFSLVHLLAMSPSSLKQCVKKLRAKEDEIESLLKKIGTSIPGTPATWKPTDKAYRELDVWNFPYRGDDDRQTAINNAIRAYDRMRIAPDDAIWQKLLPESERGQGKTLSKLKIADLNTRTPSMLPKNLGKKSNPLKKLESKKAGDAAAVKKAAKEEKAKKEAVQKKEEKEIVVKRANGTKPAANKPQESKSTADKHSKSSSSDSEPLLNTKMAKKGVQSKGPSSAATGKPKPKDAKTKPSTAAKALLNKPKNPSPLGGSPPVNASDFEDDHPVNKAFASANSPSKSSPEKTLKRKVVHMNGESGKLAPNKKPNLATSPNPPKIKSFVSSTASTKLKRKGEDEAIKPSTPKIRKIVNGETAPSRAAVTPSSKSSSGSNHVSRPSHRTITTNGHRTPQSSDDSGSPPLALSKRQAVDMAMKFKRYYDRYYDLHKQLTEDADPPTPEKRAELLRMRDTLQLMKKQLSTGAIGM